MTYLRRALCLPLLAALPAMPALAAPAGEQGPLLQVFLGVLELDDQTGQWEDISGDTVDVDFSSLPAGGLEVEYTLGRGWLYWGLNPGVSVAWKNDDTNISGTLTEETGGTLRVSLDNSLLLVDLHLGGYVRGRLNDRVTTYVAAGPMVMYGSHDVKNQSVEGSPQPADGTVNVPDTSSSDTNLGYYARAGLDFEISDRNHLGLGVRYLSAELDFDKTVGKLDIKGPEYVLTFTTQL
ncbi:MAG: outer membrane beta-barrel protein [Halioglobus sp.]